MANSKDLGSSSIRYDKVGSTTDSQNVPFTRSWRAPITILTAFVAGLGLALCHHFIGWYLDGKVVTSVSVSQGWVFRISTALAFLVKMTLAISIASAFAQFQWLQLRKRDIQVREVDALTTVLGNVFSFLQGAVWVRHPLLAVIALVSW